MSTEVIPLDSFSHGGINAERDVPITVDDDLAVQLERAGLVRIGGAGGAKKTARTEPAASKAAAGNSPAAGEAQPSSASQAAPVSERTIAKPSGRGAAAKKGTAKRR